MDTKGSGCLALSLVCSLSLAAAAPAQDDRAAALFGKECSACHGPAAHGGHNGEYPRLAGLPAAYIVTQLESFRDRKRQNKPMIPVFKGGRLTRDDIEALAGYLSRRAAPTPSEVGVPETVAGDLKLGETLYGRDCAECHGTDGRGKPDTGNPPVTAQWPAYLTKQMIDFGRGRRIHENAEALFAQAEPSELNALLAYMLQLNRLAPSLPAP